MQDRFQEQRVLVTGGATGLGRGIAKAFLAEGAKVVIADIDAVRIEATARELSDLGEISALACDVTDPGQVEQTIRRSVELLGAIDVLVNDAGVVAMSSCVDTTEQAWDNVMDVNVKGVFLMMRAALPGMLARRSGSIVNVASQAGKRGYKLFAPYCASKAAVILLSKSVALEVAPFVRINCVCPGIVNTEMMDREYAWEEAMTGDSPDQIKARWMSSIPMGRFQEPEHIAAVTLFLASSDASEMTGQAINVTGGMVME